jgi:excisionase family DNA binding protein
MTATLPITHSTASERLLFSREETAEILSLSVHTVARDIRLGRIKARRYGRRVLVPREELLRIAADGMAPEAKPAAA